jgi:hypothetical protein
MHIVLAALGSIVTILWLLHRLAEMGVTLGGLNPWLWRRRRRWKRSYEANPIFSLESPMELTALLVVAVAKADGDMSSEEKREILGMFRDEFQLAEKDAAELLTAVSYMLGAGEEVRSNLPAVMAPSRDRFSSAQTESAIDLLQRIGAVGGAPTKVQMDLIAQIDGLLRQQVQPAGKWA